MSGTHLIDLVLSAIPPPCLHPMFPLPSSVGSLIKESSLPAQVPGLSSSRRRWPACPWSSWSSGGLPRGLCLPRTSSNATSAMGTFRKAKQSSELGCGARAPAEL